MEYVGLILLITTFSISIQPNPYNHFSLNMLHCLHNSAHIYFYIYIYMFPLLFCAAGQPFGHFLTGYNHQAQLLCAKLCLKGILCQYYSQLLYNCCQSLRPRLSEQGEKLWLEILHSRYNICCPVWDCIWIRETSPCCVLPALAHLIGPSCPQLVQWLDESGAPVPCEGEGF